MSERERADEMTAAGQSHTSSRLVPFGIGADSSTQPGSMISMAGSCCLLCCRWPPPPIIILLLIGKLETHLKAVAACKPRQLSNERACEELAHPMKRSIWLAGERVICRLHCLSAWLAVTYT